MWVHRVLYQFEKIFYRLIFDRTGRTVRTEKNKIPILYVSECIPTEALKGQMYVFFISLL
jgi:hypothetical protein